jgi:hypothetical protein
MNLRQNHMGALCLTILLGFLSLISSAQAQTESHLRLNFYRVPWTHLSFHAKNFWVEVSTDIQLRSLAATELDAALLASPQGIPVKLKESQAAELTINTIIDPRFRSPVRIYNRIWFEPTDASALGRVRLRRGEDDFKKMYRFTEQGVFRHRIEPRVRREAKLEPERWTDVKDTFYPFDINQLKCPVVSERSLLIYLLSAVSISDVKGPVSLCVWGKRKLHRVQLRNEGILPIKVNYLEKNQQVEIRREDNILARKIAITAQPIERSSEEAENFSFLGLHTDITVYLEPNTLMPVQVSGIIPTVGRADLELANVRLKK